MNRLMKKYPVAFALFLLCLFCRAAAAEIKKVSVPNIDMPPSLESVMNRKDSTMTKEGGKKTETATNGSVLNEGNVIVDNIADPKCVFYGNYNNGADGAFQYFNIDTIVFECR